jgi:hypothetical protein
MGVSVSTFALAFANIHDHEGAAWIRSNLEHVNDVLREAGHTTFTEPESEPDGVEQAFSNGFPYGFFYTLHRAYSRVQRGLEVIPAGEEFTPEDHDLIDEVGNEGASHLICHSISEGFYVPLEFTDPLFDERVLGSWLGSSQALLRELAELTAPLGIEVDAVGNPTPGMCSRVFDESDHPLKRERFAWLTLHQAAKISVRYGTAIHFG